MRALIFLLLTLTCCNTTHDDTRVVQFICGRDAAHALIYRIKVPADWIHKAPLSSESLADTTKSLSEFLIDEKIKITIHNFPSESLEKRIPPEAQIARWKKQFTALEPSTVSTIPQAFSGYKGLLFEGSGILHEKQQTMLGWTMQLASTHYRILTNDQLRSDVTIKVVGPSDLIEHYRDALIQFARSFELIEAIPSKT